MPHAAAPKRKSDARQLSETTGASANLDAVEARLDEVLRKHVSLQAELGQITPALREQVLSLPRIEAKLDEIAHGVLKLPIALEEFKRFLIQSPLFGDWEQFRRADPEAVKLLVEADAHFLAGRRNEGIACLQRLFGLRGVGNATLAHHLGLHQMGAGDLPAARATLATFPDGAPLPDHLSQTIAAASTFGRAGGGPRVALPAARLRDRPEVPHRDRNRPRRHGQRLPRRRHRPP